MHQIKTSNHYYSAQEDRKHTFVFVGGKGWGRGGVGVGGVEGGWLKKQKHVGRKPKSWCPGRTAVLLLKDMKTILGDVFLFWQRQRNKKLNFFSSLEAEAYSTKPSPSTSYFLISKRWLNSVSLKFLISADFASLEVLWCCLPTYSLHIFQ